MRQELLRGLLFGAAALTLLVLIVLTAVVLLTDLPVTVIVLIYLALVIVAWMNTNLRCLAYGGVVDVVPRTHPIQLGGCYYSCPFPGVVLPQSSIYDLSKPEVSIRLTHVLFDPLVIILRPQLASNSSVEFGVLQRPELLCDFS